MWFILKRLALGLTLIALASGILLYSDTDRRAQGQVRVKRVAILQHVAQATLDEGVKGVVEGLADAGFVDGQNLTIQRFNAHGDSATADAIAREICGGGFDLVITVSTLSLQAVANANTSGRVPHVFGLVSDPYVAGVGVGKKSPLDHPKQMTGIATMQPVAEAFRLARRMNPQLKVVGEVWNPSEANSEACTHVARATCKELGITLLEANADNSANVLEAAKSLVARGAEALWVGGDATVLTAIDSILSPAKADRIPVFTSIPGNAARGSLFDLGADYFEVGRLTGALGARVLEGESPAQIPVAELVPPKLMVNAKALADLKGSWQVPEETLAQADILIDDSGTHDRTLARAAKKPVKHPRLAKTWNVHLMTFVESPNSEEGRAGVLDGLRESGLVEGRDYRVKTGSAQGDMATLSSMADAAVTDGADLVVCVSTPALQGALRRIHDRPIVFTLVANPYLAGAGKTATDHLPNVTGVFIECKFDDMMSAIKKCMPTARRIGTLFVPAEVNSVYFKEQLEAAARRAGLALETVGVNSSSEVADAAASLCSRPIDAVCQISDNLSSSTFAGIAQATKNAKKPLFSFAPTQCKQGSAFVIASDYRDGGRESGLLAAEVMRGKAPGSLPFQTTSHFKRLVNLDAARAAGLTIPRSLLEGADDVIGR